MKALIATFAVIAMFFCPYMARADTALVQSAPEVPLPPNVDGWNVINMSRIALIISDTAVAYLGFETEYNNPDDLSESVKVIRRHIPLIISKNKKVESRMLSETIITLFIKGEEDERLKKISAEADAILYIHWRTARNPLTGRQNKLDGDINIWFLPADGNWIFVKNESVKTEFMTENINSDKPDKKPYNIFSGMKYQVGDTYHIVRLDRSILVALASERKR